MHTIKKTWMAWRGRALYMKLKKQLAYSDKDVILFFPEEPSKDASEDMEAALNCVPEFLEKKRAEKAFCLWAGEELDRPWISGGLRLCDDERRCLLDFYDLYNFAPNFIVVHLSLPRGRLAYRLENFKGLTKEDLYRYQVFCV